MKEIKTNEQGLGTVAVVAMVAVVGIVLLLIFAGMDDMDDEMMDDNEIEMSVNDDADMDDDAAVSAGVEVGGAMMVPNRDIVANAMNADNVTTLVAAVSAAGLVETLQGDGPFTVFAPTNAAFAKLPAGTVDTLLLPENKQQLVDILTYHVVAGAYTSADLVDGQTMLTVNGELLTIGKSGNQITVNGSAMVETKDVISSNGVTYVIDEVLLPSEA